jgi:hypothetical protein
MAPGGVILFDEYNDPPWPGCNRAVDEFLADKPEKLELINMNNYQKYFIMRQGGKALVEMPHHEGARQDAAQQRAFRSQVPLEKGN